MKVQRFKPGEIIYHVGDYKESQCKIYFIVQGEIKLFGFQNNDFDISDEKKTERAILITNVHKIWYQNEQKERYHELVSLYREQERYRDN